jgi:hypothetical protein
MLGGVFVVTLNITDKAFLVWTNITLTGFAILFLLGSWIYLERQYQELLKELKKKNQIRERY